MINMINVSLYNAGMIPRLEWPLFRLSLNKFVSLKTSEVSNSINFFVKNLSFCFASVTKTLHIKLLDSIWYTTHHQTFDQVCLNKYNRIVRSRSSSKISEESSTLNERDVLPYSQEKRLDKK